MIKEIDKEIGMSIKRYNLLFLLNNSFGFFRLKNNDDLNNSLNYDCIYYREHDCVIAEDVLIDIMLHMRSGDEVDLVVGDIIAIRINGILYSYRFCGISSWNLNQIEENFENIGTVFFKKEVKRLIKNLHSNSRVLDVLKGQTIPLTKKDDLKKYNFYGIEKEDYSFSTIDFVTEYNIYKLYNGQIVNANPNESSFYNIDNVMFYYLKNYKDEKLSVLLYGRKELEMIKDYIDIDND